MIRVTKRELVAALVRREADSLAWSYHARREPPLPGCNTHKNCANCVRFALAWREETLEGLERAARQGVLPLRGAA